MYDEVHAVKDVNLEIRDKGFMVLIGPDRARPARRQAALRTAARPAAFLRHGIESGDLV
jgi:hypothetical protein